MTATATALDTDIEVVSDNGFEDGFTIPVYAQRVSPEISYEDLLDVARGEYLDYEDAA